MCVFSIEVLPPGFAPCFLVLVLKLGCWPPVYNNNGSRLVLHHNLLKNRALGLDFLSFYNPFDTSSKCIEESRSRLGLRSILPPSRGSRMILPPKLLKNRRIALDFSAVYYRIAAPAKYFLQIY